MLQDEDKISLDIEAPPCSLASRSSPSPPGLQAKHSHSLRATRCESSPPPGRVFPTAPYAMPLPGHGAVTVGEPARTRPMHAGGGGGGGGAASMVRWMAAGPTRRRRRIPDEQS